MRSGPSKSGRGVALNSGVGVGLAVGLGVGLAVGEAFPAGSLAAADPVAGVGAGVTVGVVPGSGVGVPVPQTRSADATGAAARRQRKKIFSFINENREKTGATSSGNSPVIPSVFAPPHARGPPALRGRVKNVDALSVYLRDHLAGSEAARAMLQRAAEGEDGEFFAELDREIAEDQEALKTLIDHLGSTESLIKKAGAWLSEKMTRLKLDDLKNPLDRFEFLEVLLLGVRGKQALWEALHKGMDPALLPPDWDFPGLIARAHAQLDRIEARRLEAFVQFASA